MSRDWFHIIGTLLLGLLLAINFMRDRETMKLISAMNDNAIHQAKNVDTLLQVTNGLMQYVKQR